MQSYNQFGGPYYQNKVNNYGQQPRSEINQYVFVNGIEGAKAYQIMPNQSIMLMDSDSPLVFMKTADAQGRSSIRYFKLVEVSEDSLKSSTSEPNLNAYASKEDLESVNKKLDILSNRLDKLSKKESKGE